MSDASTNPYQSLDATDDANSPAAGFWRDGEYLVVRRKRYSLPDRCILCNDGARGRSVRVKLEVPRASILSENASTVVRFGICDAHLRRRRSGLFLRSISGPVGAAAGFGVLVAWPRLLFSIFGIVVLVAFLGLFGAAIFYGIKLSTIPIAPVRIDKRFVWIQGVLPAYLHDAPPIPQPEIEPAEGNGE